MKNTLAKSLRTPFALVATACGLLFASGAQAASVPDPATIASLTSTLTNYAAAATTTNSLDATYAAYQWALPYYETTPGSGNWAQLAISNGDAETIVGVAQTMCGSDSASTTKVAQIVTQLTTYAGVSAANSYKASRGSLCTALQAAAQMIYRYKEYQNYKTNGYTIKALSKTDHFSFPGDHHRTASFGLTLKYYPDVQDTVANGFTLDDKFSYESWFKWSDNSQQPLNIVARLRDALGGDTGGICFPFISGDTASASLCMKNMTVNVDSSTSSVSMNLYAKFHAYDRTKTLDFGTVTLPAPFGFLNEMSQMKDSAKQNVMNKIQAQVVALTGLDKQTVTLLQTIATKMASGS